jgi:hypothetical protein
MTRLSRQKARTARGESNEPKPQGITCAYTKRPQVKVPPLREYGRNREKFLTAPETIEFLKALMPL